MMRSSEALYRHHRAAALRNFIIGGIGVLGLASTPLIVQMIPAVLPTNLVAPLVLMPFTVAVLLGFHQGLSHWFQYQHHRPGGEEATDDKTRQNGSPSDSLEAAKQRYVDGEDDEAELERNLEAALEDD